MSARFLTVAEIAASMRKSERCIRDWITKGCPANGVAVKLEATKFGKSWRISEEDRLVFEHRVRTRSGRPDPDPE